MFETEELQQRLNHSRDDLLRAITQASERAELGRINESKAKNVESELASCVLLKNRLTETVNHMVKIYKNIEKYAYDRKQNAEQMLKLAIHKAGYIVPNADVAGIELCTNENKVSIVNQRGQDINLREGSAYRTIMGMLMRYTLIKEQPDKIPAIFCDEYFSTLSDETTSSMREYFDAFKDDILIVGIEQHNTLFQGLATTRLRAEKTSKGTVIIKEGKWSADGETV